MSEKDLQAQLEELKQQLQDLVVRQGEDRQTQSETFAAAMDPEAGSHASPSKEWLRSLTRNVGDLLHELKIDLNEVPAATAILLFGVGVFIGRMTSKK